MLRSLFGMARSLDKTLTKLMAVSSPAADAFRPDPLPCVEMLALMALSDLEQLEGLWLELMQSKDPESVALAFRLALAHMATTSKRLMGAMVLDRLDAEEGATAHEAVGHY